MKSTLKNILVIHFLWLSIMMFDIPLNSKPHSVVDAQKTYGQVLFADKSNADLYWKALLQVANNDKEGALKTIAAIKEGGLVVQESDTSSIDVFFDQLFLDSVMTDPQELSGLGLFESIGIKEHNAHLTDVSPEASFVKIEQAKERLKYLQQHSIEQLSKEQLLSYKIFYWKLCNIIDGEPFIFHEYRINQMIGILEDLSTLFMHYHRLDDQEDVVMYIARLSKISEQFLQAIRFMDMQKNRGIVPPHFAIEKVIHNIRKMTPEAIESQIFYNRIACYLEENNIENKDALLEQAKKVIESCVYPAYKMIQDYFVELLKVAQRNDGVWSLPNGDAYYSYALKEYTTTDLSADEIHALGLEEVRTIHQKMRSLLELEGVFDPNKSIGTLVQDLSKEARFYFPNTDEGRTLCLKHYEAILERSRKELNYLFDVKPTVGVQIERVPVHKEEGEPQAYYEMPSMDAHRPGVFFANLRNMDEVPVYGMETLTIHEAEPGHHFQLALQLAMPIPVMRKLGDYTAYIEGWALYAEKLAYEYNFYSSAFAQLGHLRDELLRAVRLVVDTGIHHKRWTREQAIEYMKETIGFHHDSVVTEVERYFIWPGQACAYKIGQLKILELRQRAKDALKDNFSIQEFHNIVLEVGAVPLMVLEEVVDNYIQRKLATT